MTTSAPTASWQKQIDYRQCGETGCALPLHAEGRCARHYVQWRARWRDVCPGHCNDRWRKADGEYRAALAAYDLAFTHWLLHPDGPRPGKPAPAGITAWRGDRVLCGRCQATLRRELSELSDLAAIVDAEFSGQRRGPDSERVSGSRHAPSPSPVADDLDELGCLLRDWEGAARRGDTYPRRGYLASEIATVCARLATACFPPLTENPDTAAEFQRDVHAWHKRLKTATKTGTGRHVKPRPCPRCDRFSLVWTEGEKYVACQTETPARCGYLMLNSDYDEYNRLYDHLGNKSGGSREAA